MCMKNKVSSSNIFSRKLVSQAITRISEKKNTEKNFTLICLETAFRERGFELTLKLNLELVPSKQKTTLYIISISSYQMCNVITSNKRHLFKSEYLKDYLLCNLGKH